MIKAGWLRLRDARIGGNAVFVYLIAKQMDSKNSEQI